jgi:hypothetical protein
MNDLQFSRRAVMRAGVTLAAGAMFSGSLFSGCANLENSNQPLDSIPSPNSRKPKRIFDVRDYGAVGDGVASDTAAIQRAIDEAAAAGGGAQVLVRGGHQYLISTLHLRSHIDFHLADDAELLVSTQPQLYDRDVAIAAKDAVGLTLSGTGRINGRAEEFMTHFDEKDEWWRPAAWRPRLYELIGCKDLEVRDFTIFQAPSWSLHMIGCERVLIDRLQIRNHLDLPNCDGIDPDHCRDVEIRNCHIVCGDDAIVIKTTRQKIDYGPSANIVVKDCVLETQDSGVKIGTETTQDIHHIRFERIQVKNCCRGLCIQLRDEGNVYDIDFKDMQFTSRFFSDPWWGRGEAMSLTAIPRTKETKLGKLHDVRVSNIKATAENSVRINGTDESRIQNVSLENVSVKLDRWTKYRGGVFDNRPTHVYPEIEEHRTPGIHIRKADNILLKHCGIAWGDHIPEYFTHALEASGVTGLLINDFKGEAAHPGRDQAIQID